MRGGRQRPARTRRLSHRRRPPQGSGRALRALAARAGCDARELSRVRQCRNRQANGRPDKKRHAARPLRRELKKDRSHGDNLHRWLTAHRHNPGQHRATDRQHHGTGSRRHRRRRSGGGCGRATLHASIELSADHRLVFWPSLPQQPWRLANPPHHAASGRSRLSVLCRKGSGHGAVG